MCQTDFSVRPANWLSDFQLKPSKLTIVPQEAFLHIFIAKYRNSSNETAYQNAPFIECIRHIL